MQTNLSALITGANGFIGQGLVRRLVDQGINVWAHALHPHNCSHALIRPVAGDITYGEGLEEVPWERLDLVFHLAAAGVKATRRIWSECVEVNIVGTSRILDLLERHDSKAKLIYLRSFYELGLSQAPALRDNPYVITKQAATHLVETWARRNISRNVLMGTVYQGYGPNDAKTSVLNYAYAALMKNELVRLSQPGLNRDWIYIDDVVDCLLAMSSTGDTGLSRYDVGTGVLTTLSTVVEKLAKLMGKDSSGIIFDQAIARGDSGLELSAQHFVPGWSPRVDLNAGLRSLITKSTPALYETGINS
jgi:nucleoside-diphosphate-sugar epimerase